VQTFIARQPIFDQRQKVFAYELLFRSSLENVCNQSDLDQAASKVIADSSLLMGIENITCGKKAFVNATRDTLVNEYVGLFPRGITVVEILETVTPDREIIDICRKLKQDGYLLALDDFVYRENYKALLDIVDIIKVDVLETNRQEQESLVKQFAPRGIQLLAEKVETQDAFKEALDLGYTYFQGYFFSKPVILSGRDVPGFKLQYFRMVKEINQPELDFGEIEQIIKRDMSLSYKLLRYINSAAFNWRSEINSIKQALGLLGEKDVKKWASLIAITNMSKDKPEELVITAVTRAKFCENLSQVFGMKNRSDDLFLMGMFSMLDAILDRALLDVLREIPVNDEIKTALLGGENRLGDVYNYALGYEKGDWLKITEIAEKLKIDESTVPKLYLDSVEWARQSFQKGSIAA
jgi:c-di-GMP-related signal transduction protein